jgi:hypothetical protein
LFRGSSSDVIVHPWLEMLLKIFHSDCQAWIELMQAPDDLELV